MESESDWNQRTNSDGLKSELLTIQFVGPLCWPLMLVRPHIWSDALTWLLTSHYSSCGVDNVEHLSFDSRLFTETTCMICGPTNWKVNKNMYHYQIRVEVLTLCWIYLPWYATSPFKEVSHKRKSALKKALSWTIL